MKILFIGNSYTHCNDLPGMVRQFGFTLDETWKTDLIAPGGQTLEGHWYTPETHDAIGKGWNFVVLQEQSTRPVEDPEKFLSAAQRLVESIRASGACPVLYLTWARKYLPDMTHQLERSYREVSAQTGAAIVPVGLAWSKVREEYPSLLLYEEDQSHPTSLGTYLSACVFYSVLTGRTPVGLPARVTIAPDVCLEVAKEAVLPLQRSADTVCRAERQRDKGKTLIC